MLAVFNNQDFLAVADELKLMRHQDDHLIFEVLNYTLLEDLTRDFRVHCAERVVKQKDVSIRVHGPCKTDSSLLAARDIDSTLANHGVFAFCKHVHVLVQLADPHCSLEALLVIVEPKANILLDRGRENEWLLLNICDASFDIVHASSHTCLAHESVQQRCLTTANGTDHDQKLAFLNFEVHL